MGGRRSSPGDGIIQAAQSVAVDGSVTVIVGEQIPVDPQTTALTAATAGSEVFRTVQLNGHTYRVLSQALGADRGVIEVARDLTDTQHVLEDLAWTTLWVGLAVLTPRLPSAGWRHGRSPGD